MRRDIIIFGAIGGVLIALLKLLEFRYLVAEHSLEIYGGLIAGAEGAIEARLARRRAEMQKFQELYRNPLINAAITFLEPFSIGLVVSLMSAGLLRRQRDSTPTLTGASGSGISAVV